MMSNDDIGKKFDDGKTPAYLPDMYFPLALLAISEVCEHGAQTYGVNTWHTIPSPEIRYKNAKRRHALKEAVGEECDIESGLLHAAHEAWGALAVLELKLRELDKESESTKGKEICHECCYLDGRESPPKCLHQDVRVDPFVFANVGMDGNRPYCHFFRNIREWSIAPPVFDSLRSGCDGCGERIESDNEK